MLSTGQMTTQNDHINLSLTAAQQGSGQQIPSNLLARGLGRGIRFIPPLSTEPLLSAESLLALGRTVVGMTC